MGGRMQNSSALVLVGGFGFVGRNILDTLGRSPDLAHLAPQVIDDLSNAAPGHEGLDLPAHIGSYDTDGALDFLRSQDRPEGGRVFVFLAGETRVAESKDRPMDFIEANITAPARFVLEAIEPGDSFILISTAGALFDGSFEVAVDSPYCPKNFYGATKAAEEMILGKLVELRGARFSVIRMTNVFGRFSDNKKSAVHAFTRAAIAGAEVTINGDGHQSRDFVYAGDVGRGIARLASRMAAGEDVDPVHMLASGVSTSLWDVVGAVEEATGKPLKYIQIPAEDLIRTEPRDVIARASDAQVLLGAEVTSFVDGIRQTHGYYAG